MKFLLPTLLAAALVVAAPASAAPVPSTIQPPAGNEVSLTAHAVGVQIYSCTPGSGWTLTGPRANLYDQRGRVIATHFAGPTWQHVDGSSVVGKKVAGVSVDQTAIDWLLLSATPSGTGRLAGTTYVQRIHTVGGLAPAASSCTVPGATVEVPYTAKYVFWKAHHCRRD